MSDSLVECSNMGICNRITGTCSCIDGFEGSACSIMSCPGAPACNDRGQCLTMSELAAHATRNGDPTAYTYGATPNNQLTWDFDMVGNICAIVAHIDRVNYRCEAACVTMDIVAMTVRSSHAPLVITRTPTGKKMKCKPSIVWLLFQVQRWYLAFAARQLLN